MLIAALTTTSTELRSTVLDTSQDLNTNEPSPNSLETTLPQRMIATTGEATITDYDNGQATTHMTTYRGDKISGI